MSARLVEVDRRGRTAVLTLAREEKLNAISAEVESQFCAALRHPDVLSAACVVFTGGERVFTAGADLNEFRGLDPGAIMSYYAGTGDFVERVADLPQATFAAVSGYCLGAGVELALACDFRIADQSATFGLPEIGLGILPSFGGTYRLVRTLGPAKAKELILLRERIDAEKARELGLLTELVDRGQALACALEHAERLAELPQLAVSVTRRVIEAMVGAPRETGLELERIAYGMLAQTPEADDAVRRFIDD